MRSNAEIISAIISVALHCVYKNKFAQSYQELANQAIEIRLCLHSLYPIATDYEWNEVLADMGKYSSTLLDPFLLF